MQRCPRVVWRGVMFAAFVGCLLWKGGLFVKPSEAVPAGPHTIASTTSSPAAFTITEISPTLVQVSFDHTRMYTVASTSRILLVPHHLAAGFEIASLLESRPAPKHVLLLSPDHFSQGKQPFSTTRATFSWQGKEIAPETTLTSHLLVATGNALRVQENVFEHEHGVRGLLPFIKRAWPEATVNAITVRADTSAETISALRDVLIQTLANDPDLVIVMTIDFSHELPAYLANLHDAYAIQQLEQLHADANKTVEIDSPPLFSLLVQLVLQEQQFLHLHAHSNSLQLMQAAVTTAGTSHVLMSASSERPITSSSTFTFFFDPRRPIESSEDRALRGYTQVKQTEIPFPTAFVAERTSTTTHWMAIPLEQATDSKNWNVVSDARFASLKSLRQTWEQWADTQLSKNISE